MSLSGGMIAKGEESFLLYVKRSHNMSYHHIICCEITIWIPLNVGHNCSVIDGFSVDLRAGWSEYLTQDLQIEWHFQFCLGVIMVWDLALVQARVVEIRVYYL